jgi:aminoglycoside phosphotransferase family enzyme
VSPRASDSQTSATVGSRQVQADPDPRLIEAILARQPIARVPPRIIRTSGAWVILSGDEAWKCRRPGQTRFADLTEVGSRRAACLAELELNRRFSPDVYLGLDALLVRGDGRAELVEVDVPGARHPPGACMPDGGGAEGAGGGHGRTPRPPSRLDAEPIEWVIRMKRLAAAGFLDAALDAGQLHPDEVGRIATRLRDLHRQAPVSSVEPSRFAERFVAEIEIGAELLGVWGGAAAATLAARARSLRGELERRVREAAVIDGHGDLRPAHLSLDDEVRLIDALDCDALLRQVDPWEELSLLALMAAEQGAGWFGPLLARSYGSSAWMAPCPELLAFYCAYHAFTRARLACDHLRRSPAQRVDHWQGLTRRFMRSTEASLQGWSALGAGP